MTPRSFNQCRGAFAVLCPWMEGQSSGLDATADGGRDSRHGQQSGPTSVDH